MVRSIHSIVLIFLVHFLSAQVQQYDLRGVITDPVNKKPLSGVEIMLTGTAVHALTDDHGRYMIMGIAPGDHTLRASTIGYGTLDTLISFNADRTMDLTLERGAIDLREVKITPQGSSSSAGPITTLDLLTRPVNSSQDLLQLVPGLFIAQHAGGGKAEQIFFRGFDIDHGTDLLISVDGMPVNMVSHAHGQGYADLHFVIPETMDALTVHKGPYDAKFGDFATSGTVELSTKNAIEGSSVKLEAGMFNTKRVVGLIDLLGKKHLLTKRRENAYIAAEYVFTDSYFQNKQDMGRFNIFGKYTGQLNDRTFLTLSASTFSSAWNASGQVPSRAVRNGTIDRFGSIDPNEGGNTSRTNANVILNHGLSNGGYFKNQLYAVKYDFNLYSNFTFFAMDSVRGDMIVQTDERLIGGYTGSYHQELSVLGKALQFNAGIGGRYDRADVALKNAVARVIYDTTVAGSVHQLNAFSYVDGTLSITDRLDINAAIRFDALRFAFADTRGPEQTAATATQYRPSPKLNFNYTLSNDVQVYLRTGMGFHSNDARAVIVGNASRTLPKAYGVDLGTTFKPMPRMLINTAIWGLYLESELVYVGDGGVIETNNPTERTGIDLSVRYQLTTKLFADLDVNVVHGRTIGTSKNEDHIPLAPQFTTIGGLAYKQERGLNWSIRYRHMADRPANADNSVVAKGYFLVDASASYRLERIEFGASVENLFNALWNQAQFDTQSRLPGESDPVSELHFTPGTPFFLKGTVSYRFK